MRRGEDNPINHALLRESILQSIAYLQSKVYIQEKEVYELVRAFFKEYLGLDYEFTHEELLIELQNIFYDKKLEDQVLNFLRDISKIEYSDEEFPPENLKKILSDFSVIVDVLIKKQTKGKSFLKKLVFWKEHIDEQIPVEREEEEEIVEVLEDMEKNVSADRKKDLFGNQDKPKKETRIIEEKIETNFEKHKLNEEHAQKAVSNSLASLTADLNDHIEKSRQFPKKELALEIPKPEKNELLNEMPLEKSSKESSENSLNNLVTKTKSKNNVNKTHVKNSENKKIMKKNTKKKSVALKNEKPVDNSKKSLPELIEENKKSPKKELYLDIQKKYDALPEEEKNKYYDDVLSAYELVK